MIIFMRRITFTGWMAVPLLVWMVCLQQDRRNMLAGIVIASRSTVVDKGLWTPPIKCDYLSPCRCLQDLHGENPRYPRGLHHLVCPEIPPSLRE